jgi:Domain of unknown function (DUF4915)
MPHSPRLNAGTLSVLDSGHGYLCRVDEKSGKAERVTFCPGFARGLSFWRGHALVATSLPRDGAFKGLELEDNVKARDGESLRRLYHRHASGRHLALDQIRRRGARAVRRELHPRRQGADVRRPRQSRDAHAHLRRGAIGSTAEVVAQ